MSELSQEARALIDSVSKLDDPSDADRARVKQRVALSLGAAAFTAVAVTQAAGGAGPGLLGTMKAGLWSTTGKLALCAGMLGGALMLGWPSGQTTSRSAPAAKRSASAEQRAAAPERQAAPSPAAAPEAPAAVFAPASDPVIARERTSPRRAASREPAPQPRAADAQNTLALELALLGDAQAALRAGQPERALSLAHEHQARFPAGVLREERLGIETLSECTLGRKDPARAQAFLGAAPGSPLAARVRKACGLE